MIRWIKNNLDFKLIAFIFIVTPIIVFFIRELNDREELIITVKFDKEQLVKLKEISKKDLRDVDHTVLMLADDYIKYHENNEVVK